MTRGPLPARDRACGPAAVPPAPEAGGGTCSPVPGVAGGSALAGAQLGGARPCPRGALTPDFLLAEQEEACDADSSGTRVPAVTLGVKAAPCSP